MAAFLRTEKDFKRLMLSDFLESTKDRIWIWGQSDCTMWAADWIRRLHERDPAQLIRGLYADPDGAVQIAQAHGGFYSGVSMVLDGMPLERIAEDFETGDVAVVTPPKDWPEAPIAAGLIAIRQKEWWLVKTIHGLVGREFPVIAAWRT